VHGDYRLDNLLIDNSQLRAVIDWEISTLGDALTDVALLVAYGNLADLAPDVAPVDVAARPATRQSKQILSMYAAATGSDLDSLHFHMALAYFKPAVILEGIHFRHTKGQTVGDGFDSVGQVVVPLLEAGVHELSKTLGKL
jgi:aminoglycoside phosphotransferase (APT) family kinase protein